MGTVLNSLINSEYDEAYTKFFFFGTDIVETNMLRGLLLLLLMLESIICETDNWLNLQILLA